MNYLQARKALAEFHGGEPLELVFATSGTAEPFDVYLRAAAAGRNRAAVVRTLPFGTLGQRLATSPVGGETEVFLLCPWDLVPECDWRTGVSPALDGVEECMRRAELVISSLTLRDAAILYLDAPLAPLWVDAARNLHMREWLRVRLREVGAIVLPEGWFALGAYLSSGCPVAGRHHWDVADRAISACLRELDPVAKVLVTDLDNTLWHGVVGDVGPNGIEFAAHGQGFMHFVYQTFLQRLQSEGVLLAAVSKNDDAVARAPLSDARMVLGADAFVAILASWNAKSAQISALADRLNLGLDSFVFVDDNEVELEEVNRALPAVRTLRFPDKADGLPSLLDDLARLFRRSNVTEEDRRRTELYRIRLEGMVPVDASGADLRAFLAALTMRLVIHDRSGGERERAVQLINKTNQFNLNGVRLTEADVQAVLDAGGRLLTASLSDRGGSHGEILACLIHADGSVRSLVLSCRVFQRRVEFAFLSWLIRSGVPIRRFRFVATERNGPLQDFLRAASGVTLVDAECHVDPVAFLDAHHEDLALFEIEAPDGAIRDAGADVPGG